MKLGLGTVQFGLDYGISNIKGKVSANEAARILDRAEKAGIRLLDTAPAYGESEKVLGQFTAGQRFDLITKTQIFNTSKITPPQVQHMREFFYESLGHLNIDKIYGLLCHHAEDLLVPGGELVYQQMQELKSEGKVKKIGVSVYDQDQIERLINNYKIDIIQLPVNVLDQRLVINGYLGYLKSIGIEIHSRSVFLQGLLLVQPNKLNDYFSPIKKLLTIFKGKIDALKISPLVASLNFVKNIKEIDCCLVGVDSLEQFEQILASYRVEMPDEIDFNSFVCDDKRMINPSLWKL